MAFSFDDLKNQLGNLDLGDLNLDDLKDKLPAGLDLDNLDLDAIKEHLPAGLDLSAIEEKLASNGLLDGLKDKLGDILK
ncbi:MAG TPA: hypothetical protein VGM95_00215 [Lactobacillaceae bacterium]|jgi:hypothetical protein